MNLVSASRLIYLCIYIFIPILIIGCSANNTQKYMKEIEQNRKINVDSLYKKELENKGLNYELYLLEKGRLAQLSQDYKTSKTSFSDESDLLKSRELGDDTLPTANITIGSILVNDNLIPYRARLFEVEMIYLYQCYNYLALGDMEGALVEIRLADFLMNEAEKARQNVEFQDENYQNSEADVLKKISKDQDNIKNGIKKSELQIGTIDSNEDSVLTDDILTDTPNISANISTDTATDTSNADTLIKTLISAPTGSPTDMPANMSKGVSADTSINVLTTMPAGIFPDTSRTSNTYINMIQKASDDNFKKMGEVLSKSKSSVLNPYVLYMSGLLHEMNNELDDAYISYKKGLELMPANPYSQKAVIRLAIKLGKENDFQQLETAYPELWMQIKSAPQRSKEDGRLVVLYEEGWVPVKKQIFISLGGFAIAYPIYDFIWIDPIPLIVSENSEEIGQTYPVCYMGALALRALQEEAKWRIIRQSARAAIKAAAFASGAATTAAGSSKNDQVLELIGVGIMSATSMYNNLSERADVRCWMTLPDNAQIMSIDLPAREYKLTFAPKNSASTLKVAVPVQKEKTTILRIVKVGQRLIYERLWPENENLQVYKKILQFFKVKKEFKSDSIITEKL